MANFTYIIRKIQGMWSTGMTKYIIQQLKEHWYVQDNISITEHSPSKQWFQKVLMLDVHVGWVAPGIGLRKLTLWRYLPLEGIIYRTLLTIFRGSENRGVPHTMYTITTARWYMNISDPRMSRNVINHLIPPRIGSNMSVNGFRIR